MYIHLSAHHAAILADLRRDARSVLGQGKRLEYRHQPFLRVNSLSINEAIAQPYTDAYLSDTSPTPKAVGAGQKVAFKFSRASRRDFTGCTPRGNMLNSAQCRAARISSCLRHLKRRRQRHQHLHDDSRSHGRALCGQTVQAVSSSRTKPRPAKMVRHREATPSGVLLLNHNFFTRYLEVRLAKSITLMIDNEVQFIQHDGREGKSDEGQKFSS